MRRQIIVIFCLLLGFTLHPVRAEQPAAAPQATQVQGALFKLEHNGHTGWLFGTIHVGAPEFFPLEPRVTAVLEKASVLALEIDPLADPALMMQALREYAMYAPGSGPALSEVSKPYRPRLARLLKRYGMPAEAVAPLRPWMLAAMLTVGEFAAQGYKPEYGVDRMLALQARQHGVKVVELESASQQMQLFGRLSPAEQLRFLEDSIDAIEGKVNSPQPRDIALAWRKADQAKLEALAKQAVADKSFSGKFVQKVLLDERNPKLADGIVDLMANGQDSVAAIGILHLVGSGSVPELLRRRGVAVERIY